MAWGRLHDRASGDAKLLALSDAGWRMWGCGLIYCQANLTDGFIPTCMVSTFGVRAKRLTPVIDELCSVLVPGKGPLWHRVEGGYRVHDYLDWNDSRDEILKRREADRKRKGFRPDSDRTSSRNDGGFQLDSVRPTSTTTTTEEEVPPDPQDLLDDEAAVERRFEQFWTAYPRRVAKAGARRLWRKLRPTEALAARIVQAVERQRLCDQWTRDDGKFIPHPTTWLNQRRWEDELGVDHAIPDTAAETEPSDDARYPFALPCEHTPRCANGKICGEKRDAEDAAKRQASLRAYENWKSRRATARQVATA